MVGFRNMLAHVYWQVDLTTFWAILKPYGELQELKKVVVKLNFPCLLLIKFCQGDR
ncbi:MAG: HepT-like ribonuclease domain-containing protein [Xenococcaceae cyanobacterium]